VVGERPSLTLVLATGKEFRFVFHKNKDRKVDQFILRLY